MPQGRAKPPPLDELPEVLRVGATGRTVRREEIATLAPEERKALWYEARDDVGVYAVFPFLDDTEVFGWPTLADYLAARAEKENSTPKT